MPTKKLEMLTVDQILEKAPADCKTEEIEVPEWGGLVKVRSLTAQEQADMLDAGIGSDSSDGANRKGLLAKVERIQFRSGVVEPAFTEEQVKRLQAVSGPGWRKVIGALDALAGDEEKELRESRKRFPSSGD